MSKAGARAARRNKVQSPVGGHHEPTPQEARKIRIAISEPRVLSTICFSLAGVLAGLVTGLNHFPSFAGLGAFPQVMLLGAYLGDPHVDFLAGIATAFAGLAIGGSLGFSALSEARDLGLSVLLSTLLTVPTVIYTGNMWLAGIAFLIGHLPVFLAYRRLQQA